jgi:hypothetical protein
MNIKITNGFEIQTEQPLEYKRGPVQNKIDLINPNSWAHEGDVYYVYEGMLVPVISSKDIYMLVDKSKILSPDYSGWALVGSGSSGMELDGGTAISYYTQDQIINTGGASATE